MWQKYLPAVLIFFILAVMQNSFFSHFAFFGSTPNLVFIFFILLVFFSGRHSSGEIIIYSFLGGFFADIYSYNFLGTSAILFMLSGFLAKKAQNSLLTASGETSFEYFAPIYAGAFVFFLAISWALGNITNIKQVNLVFDMRFFALLIYNFLSAVAGYFIFKKSAKFLV